MTRIIAGKAGGRRLAVPPGQGTRPTSDRAREGLFGTLLSEVGPLDGKKILDLYAGSGAVGLEALSRGARSVLLVEADARAAAMIKANIKTVDLPGARVVTARAERLLDRPARVDGAPDDGSRGDGSRGDGRAPDGGRYDVVFADPPYAVTQAELTRVLSRLTQGWLSEGALVVVERATRDGDFDWPPGYAAGKSRRYGEATFWYGWHGLPTSAFEE
ncbi:MAG TPA: RsmD family RNA methyltransferase [Trebonia sp.]|nr:RsmD family RNA methyltransferase [Trebonia sp.]